MCLRSNEGKEVGKRKETGKGEVVSRLFNCYH